MPLPCSLLKSGASVTRGAGIQVFPTHSVTMPSIKFIGAVVRYKPDVVHLLDVHPGCIGFLLLCCLLSTPTVISHHSRIDLYSVGPRE
eukprot:6177000-Pleurochrysis_carterae.AAC.2